MFDSVVVYNKSVLAAAIAKRFNAMLVEVEVASFADTETVIKISSPEKIKNKRICVVAEFCFSQSVNEQLFPLLLLLHQIKGCGAFSITVVFPYLPYGRQAESFEGTRPGPLQAVEKFLTAAGVDRIVVCEAHEPLSDISWNHITLDHFWKDIVCGYFPSAEQKEIVFLSPDRGGVERLDRLAKLLKLPTAFVEKKRINGNEPTVLALHGEVRNKIVVMIDDIVDTGVTAVKAAKMVLDHGARRVICCFAHGVLSKGAQNLLDKSEIEAIWITNTIRVDDTKMGKKIKWVAVEDFLVSRL